MPTKSRNRRSPKKLARRMKTTHHLLRRKRSGKKGSARARIPKKMRGGVTRRRLSQLTQQELSTALQLLPADVVKQIGKRHPLLIPPFTNDTLRRAVEDYLAGGARKQRVVTKYGEISNWDVSNVTNMENMFELEGAVSFNHASFAPDSLISTQAPKKASPSRRRPPTARRSGSRCPRGRRPARRCTCACPWRCRRRSRKALPS